MTFVKSLNNNAGYEVAFKAQCDLGEGPVWDKANQRIFWVNITHGEIHWLYPAIGIHHYCKLNQMVGAIALIDDGRILAALQTGFAVIDVTNGTILPIADPENELTDNRFNDGKCDTAGRFWAGTMNMVGCAHKAALYTLNADFSVSSKIQNVTIANGLAWSPDDKLFYFIDTPTNQVAAYDYDPLTGDITNRRVVVDLASGGGYADGMTIDTNGMLWIALWDGWKVERWNPQSGNLIGSISLPVSRPTSCAFGGPDMNDLYITSARYGLTDEELLAQPLAGSLFVVKNTGQQGLPVNEFKTVNLSM